MKSSKLKIMPFFLCCLISALWSSVQCADTSREEMERTGDVLRYQVGISRPAGEVTAFAGEVPPKGWLLCNGQIVSSFQYRGLYEVIGRRFTPVDSNPPISEELFCVPDLRGRTIIGVDGGAGRVTTRSMLGESGGEEKVVIALNQIPSHIHVIECSPKTQLGGIYPVDIIVPSRGNSFQYPRETGSAGGNEPHENMQPYQALNHIISVGVIDTRIDELERKIQSLESILKKVSDF